MVERKRGSPVIYFLIFCKNCCHSATNLPKPLCFRRMRVVAARWQVAAKPKQAHQPHPQPLPEREGSGCAQGVAAGSVVTSNDSPKPFTTVKTAFSCGENTVFQRRKRRTPAWQHTHCAQPPPSLSGRGWGWGWWGFAATLPPSATTSASPLYKGISEGWWQSGSKNRKKFFIGVLHVFFSCSISGTEGRFRSQQFEK